MNSKRDWLLLPSDLINSIFFISPSQFIMQCLGSSELLEKQLFKSKVMYHVNSLGFLYDKHVLGHIQRAEELRGTISKYSQDTRPSFLPWSPCQKLVRMALLLPSMYLWLGRSRQQSNRVYENSNYDIPTLAIRFSFYHKGWMHDKEMACRTLRITPEIFITAEPYSSVGHIWPKHFRCL